MFGSDNIYSALNVTSVTDLLDTYLTQPALFSDVLIPQDFTGNKSINFYRSIAAGGGVEYSQYVFTINCRSNDYAGSRQMAKAVYDAINRSSYDEYYIVCDVLPTLPPADDTDNYNTPIEATIKQR